MRNHFVNGCLVAGLILAAAAPAFAENEEFSFGDRGLDLELAGGDVKANLGGRLHIDGAFFEDDITPLDDRDLDFRRARLELAITVLDDLKFRFDYDFAELSRGWKNVWVSYEFMPGFDIQAGNFTAPFSLEDVSSSNNSTFLERSLPNSMAPGFLLGGAISGHGDWWTASLGYFQKPIDNEEDSKETDGDGVAGRVTVLPWRDDDQLIHLGFGLEARSLDSGSSFRLRTRPEARLASARLIDTGTLANADQFTTLNFEAAWQSGPVTVQAQYMHMFLDRGGVTPDPEFKGWYAQASWIITGEQQGYSTGSGVFTTVKPDSEWGAVEIAARYSTLDLEDETVTGGEENNITVGVNWYVTTYMRVMANYVHAEAEPNRFGDDEDVNIGQARLQFNL